MGEISTHRPLWVTWNYRSEWYKWKRATHEKSKNIYLDQTNNEKTQSPSEMKDLQSIPIDQFTPTQQQAYENLLCFITDTRQKVKNNIRYVYRGEIEWSPQYKQSKDVKW